MTPQAQPDAPGAAGTAPGWGREDDPDDAVDRLLDAAGRTFSEMGLDRARVADVARAAGCSRGTVYRYFPDRHRLRRAFVARETVRVGQRVWERVHGLDDPADLLVEALATSVEEVRANPVLAAWFVPTAVGATSELAATSEPVTGLTSGFLDLVFERAGAAGRLRDPRPDRDAATAWVVRVVLSLLTVPEISVRGEAEAPSPVPDPETPSPVPDPRPMLRRFLVPALLTDP